MIKIGHYSVKDIGRMILPVMIGRTYETKILRGSEYYVIRMIVVALRDGLVICKRLQTTSNINGQFRVINYPRQASSMKFPPEIFKEHFNEIE